MLEEYSHRKKEQVYILRVNLTIMDFSYKKHISVLKSKMHGLMILIV